MPAVRKPAAKGVARTAAKSLHMNISQICDSHLREAVRREQESLWRKEHADFIAAHNATFERDGLPLDEKAGALLGQ